MENIINPIRFYKPKDPYYYEIDNLPLEDLLENDARLLQAATSILLQLSESGEYASKNWVNTTAHEFSRRIRDFSDVSNSADTTLASKGYFLKTTPINPGDPDGPMQWDAEPPLFEHFSDFTGATSEDVLGYDDVLKVWKPFTLVLNLADLADTEISSPFPGSILTFEPDSPNRWEPKGRGFVQDAGGSVVPSVPAENDILVSPNASDPTWTAQSPESLGGTVFCGHWLTPSYGTGQGDNNGAGDGSVGVTPEIKLSNGHYMAILQGGSQSGVWKGTYTWVGDSEAMVRGVNWGPSVKGWGQRVTFDVADWVLASKGNQHDSTNSTFQTSNNGRLTRYKDLVYMNTDGGGHRAAARRCTFVIFFTVEKPPGEYMIPRPMWYREETTIYGPWGTFNFYNDSTTYFRLSRTTSWTRDQPNQ